MQCVIKQCGLCFEKVYGAIEIFCIDNLYYALTCDKIDYKNWVLNLHYQEKDSTGKWNLDVTQ